VKGDQWTLLDVEEVFALEFFVLHAASGVDCRGLNFYVEDAGGDIWRFEFEGGVPLLEVAGKGNRGFDKKLDGTVCRGGCEDRNLGATRCGESGERETVRRWGTSDFEAWVAHHSSFFDLKMGLEVGLKAFERETI
jgi:hypothetical protein